MYVDPIYTYGGGNIVSYRECVCYYYKIKPINSLYASNTQLQTLIETLHEKIMSVNMAGTIYILPRRVNEQRILNYYDSLFEANGNPKLKILKDSVLTDIKQQLSQKVRYRYEIYIVFTDNRDPLKKRMFSNLIKKDNRRLDKRTAELCDVVDEQIYKKLSSNLTVDRLNDIQIQQLHNYLAIPVEGTLSSYYCTPQATSLQYDYKYQNQCEYRSVFSTMLIAETIRYSQLKDAGVANTVVNRIQEYDYPVDTIIKFDLEHTQTFKRNMSSKRESIRKSANRYNRLSDRKDKEAYKAVELAKIGENVDPAAEDNKIRWQMLFRVRANDQKMLTKRIDRMMKRFEGKSVPLTYAIGDQEKLAEHIFAYKSKYNHCLNLTDVLFFAHFNFLGGLYIGEEDEGIIATYTMPADLPVLIDIEAPVKGKTKNASSTTCFAGETGSGKSQLANNFALISMIFYGHKILLIDPKGDRANLVKKINSFGDICSQLIIGSQDSPAGMFDAFLLHEDDQVEALAIAKNDIINLVRAVNKKQSLNLMNIDAAYESMCVAKQKGQIKKLTMGHLTDYLMEYDPETASNLKSLQRDPMARLFFGNDHTELNDVFKLDKPFNMITFAKLPVFSQEKGKYVYSEDDLNHRISALIISKTTEITNMFIRLEKGKPKTLLVDEAKLWSTIPGGLDVLVNNNLIARSELMNMLIILQNWSDLPESIINNTGQFFIGNMKSKQEIELILDHFDLSNNSALASVLVNRTQDEGLSEVKKFNFLYCDYNNRKAITKLKFMNTFSKAFNTFKEDDIVVKHSEIMNGDDPL